MDHISRLLSSPGCDSEPSVVLFDQIYVAADEKMGTRWTCATASPTFILHASSIKVHDGAMKTERARSFIRAEL